jgi:cephalosporin-C deacetylase-like acetyl esterase
MNHKIIGLLFLIYVGISSLSMNTACQAGPPDLAQLLSYHADVPFNQKVVDTQEKQDAMIRDIVFDSIAGQKSTQAYLVLPKTAAGPYAGILFVHWYAPGSSHSNRTEFLNEAQELAGQGVISLLVSTMWSDPQWFGERKSVEDYQNSLRQAIELRRALDVLLSQPNVDPKRIGYVGHDFGAMFGATLAGADFRPKAYVLIAGSGRYFDWYGFGAADGIPQGEALNKYRNEFSSIDPVNALKTAKAGFFFQFGENDSYTLPNDSTELYNAAPNPKRIATYPSGHEMAAGNIKQDRDVWLADQLGLAPNK